jgi:peptide/nickel transport system substrate-binding protein
LLYDSVARWNVDGTILPALGLGWATTTYDRVLDITLRPDAFFQDGKPLTADDVRWTLERVRFGGASMPESWRLEHVWRIQTLDARTVRITLEAPDASLVSSLAAPSLGVLSETVEPSNVRGGTGPFMLSFRSEKLVTLGRDPLFWQIGRPNFRALRIRPIQDDTERSTALVTGTVDLMPNAPLLDIPMLQADPSVRLVGGPSTHLCLLHVNLRAPALQDVSLRQLLSTAIDRGRLVKVAAAGQADATGLLFPQDSWVGGDVDDVDEEPPDAIRDGLAALGIRTDLRLRLITNNADATLANTAIVLQEQLAYCGIALSVALLEDDELEEAIRFGNYDLLVGYTRPWRDPHELVRPLLASDGHANHSGYSSPDVDGMIRGATLVADREIRHERYIWLQEHILVDVPVIVLFRPYYFDAMTARLADYAALQPVTARGLLPATLEPVNRP